MTHITNKLIAQKRAALDDLSKTINGGWFSSGLIFSSLNIYNELAESSNEMFKEEKRLNAFLQSFVQYTPGVKRLEESVCGGLNKVKNLEKTALSQEGINNIDASARLGTFGKVQTVVKTVVIDVGVGVVTMVGGGFVIAGAYGASVPTFFVSDALIPEGVAMVGSGANSAYNGGTDLIREINGNWGEVGSTNFIKDGVSNFSIEVTGNEKTGNLIGSVVITGIDLMASGRGAIDGIKGSYNVGKDAISSTKSIYNNYKAIGTSYKVVNAVTGEIKVVKIVNIDAEALKNAAQKVEMPAYNDVTTYFNANTVWGDISPMFSSENQKTACAVNYWLENNN